MTSHASALALESTPLRTALRSPVARMVWSYLRRYTSRLVTIVALSFASSGFEAITMGAVLAFIGVASHTNLIPLPGAGGLASTSTTIGLLLVAAVIQASLDYLRRHLAATVQRDFTEAIRGDVTYALLHRPLQWFVEHPSGEATHLLNGQVQRFSTLVPMATEAVATILQGLAVLALCLAVSLPLTGATILGAILLWLGVRLLQSKIRTLSVTVSDVSTEAAERIDEAVHAIKVVKSCGTEGLEKRKYLDVSGRLASLQVTLSDLRNLAGSLTATGFLVILVFMAATATDMVRFAAFAVLVLRLFPAMQKLVEARTGLATMYGHLDAVVTFLKERVPPAAPHIIRYNDDAGLWLMAAGIGYQHGDTPVLRWISRAFDAGEATALVGLTGSGKTTFLDILAGLREPTHGHVYRWGPGRLAYVPQDATLFTGTVLANESYGNDQCGGFDHGLSWCKEVGTRGSALSGGQRQLVALARLANSNADIWLLDEPTSAMDAETEARVMEWLLEHRVWDYGTKKNIIIVATHRLRAVQHFDRILVLHNGQVVQDGTHKELLAQEGLYARLWRLQETA